MKLLVKRQSFVRSTAHLAESTGARLLSPSLRKGGERKTKGRRNASLPLVEVPWRGCSLHTTHSLPRVSGAKGYFCPCPPYLSWFGGRVAVIRSENLIGWFQISDKCAMKVGTEQYLAKKQSITAALLPGYKHGVSLRPGESARSLDRLQIFAATWIVRKCDNRVNDLNSCLGMLDNLIKPKSLVWRAKVNTLSLSNTVTLTAESV